MAKILLMHSKAHRIYRGAGILVLATMTFQALLHDDLPPEIPAEGRVLVQVVMAVLVILLCAAFGAIFWWLTGRDGSRSVSRKGLALLALQMLIACFWTDLFFLLAAEVPFVLPARHAVRWILLQGVVTVLYCSLLVSTGDAVFTPGTERFAVPLAAAITIVNILSWQAFAFCAGYLVITERQSRMELARVNAELRATQGLLADSTRMAERLQISRELHDTLGHHLTALSLNLELAKQLAGDKAAVPVADAQAVTRLLLADVREVVGELRDDRALDLRGALETLAAGTPEPRIHLSLGDGVEVQDPAQAHVLFRCVQEAITNAVRHARARNLWIELAPEGEGVALRVRDDGKGAPEVRPGNGLTGMRERVEETGGRLEIDSRPGAGFALTAWVPSPAGWP